MNDMTQSCPKCHHVRQPGALAPDWQCPACGVAYAKASEGLRPQPLRTDVFVARQQSQFAWGKWVAAAVLAYGAWMGWQVSAKHRAEGGATEQSSAGDVQALASSVKSGDVIIYTTTTCPYCAQAKGWLTQNGFAFTECDAQTSMDCERKLQELGGVGVPFLMVKGKPMKNGFDSDEFLALLKS